MGTAYYTRAIIYHDSNSPELAIENFTRSIELKNQVARSYVMRSHSYNILGQTDKRIEDLQSALLVTRRDGPPGIVAVLTQMLKKLDAMPEDPTSAPATSPTQGTKNFKIENN